ncbi:MAG: toxin-antitoxin system HicB family antitoxin [Cyanobacteria bacterium P01_F01_bin.143]
MNDMNMSSFPLRLPRSLKEELARVSQEDNTSMNQFITITIAEKLAMFKAEAFFEKRSQNANYDTFDRLMNRDHGEPPRPGDELF